MGYLPIRLDNRTQVGHIALASLREFYGESVMDTTIRINTEFGEGGICQTNDIRLQGFGKWCRGLLRARQRNCSQVRRGAKIDRLK